MADALSFEVLGNHPNDVRAVVERQAVQLGRVGGGLLFLCGTLARQILEVGSALRGVVDAPLLLATGAGVLTERGEHEQMSACAGVVWKQGAAEAFIMDAEGDESLHDRVADAATRASDKGRAPVALFASREAVNPVALFDRSRPIDLPLFGGGTVGKPGAVVVERKRVVAGHVAGMAMRGVGRAVVRASPACQLLGEPQPVTAADGALVLSIASRPALDVLRKQATEVSGKRPVVVAVELGSGSDERPRVMLRGIRGIHESREGVMVSEDIEVGTRLTFAVLDAAAAAADLEATLREMSRETRGGVPRFGVFVDCAGRGAQLYGENGVDLQTIRRRFPRLPVVGVKSAFEVGPGLGGATTHLYSAVFCLVYAPS